MARHELALGVVVLLLLVDPTLAQPSVGPPPPPGPVTTKPPPSAPPAGPVTGMPPATPGGTDHQPETPGLQSESSGNGPVWLQALGIHQEMRRHLNRV